MVGIFDYFEMLRSLLVSVAFKKAKSSIAYDLAAVVKDRAFSDFAVVRRGS